VSTNRRPLTVVTPAFEQRALLVQCLDCVARAGDRVEHVVADGGSADGTRELLAERSDDARLRFVSDPDAGMYDALARGFALARGEILGWLNCDDLLTPWAVERVLALFDRHADVDVIYGDSLQWRDERVSLTVHPSALTLPAWLRLGGVLAQPAVFFRREMFERVGGIDTSFALMGDVDLWHRFARAGARFLKVWEVLAIERMSEDQLSYRRREEMDAERARAAGWPDGEPAAARAAWRAWAAALHRLGLSTITRGARRAQLWPQLRRSGFVDVDRDAVIRAIASTSADVTYARMTEAGRRALLGPA
jgi:GT2 family glycosyltransferase